MKADLHAHTTHSDGTKTVKEVIDMADRLEEMSEVINNQSKLLQ